MNELQTLLKTRRSIRRFKADELPATMVERILETSRHAPSAHNLQPWRFGLIKSKAAKTRLGQSLTDKMRIDMIAEGAPQSEIDARVVRSLRRIDEAPTTILLCRDTSAIRKNEQEEVTMAVQSVALAGLQLMLAAHSEGIASNWICWPLYAQDAVQEALDLPETWEPQGMIILGYPAEDAGEKTLKPLDEIMIKV